MDSWCGCSNRLWYLFVHRRRQNEIQLTSHEMFFRLSMYFPIRQPENKDENHARLPRRHSYRIPHLQRDESPRHAGRRVAYAAHHLFFHLNVYRHDSPAIYRQFCIAHCGVDSSNLLRLKNHQRKRRPSHQNLRLRSQVAFTQNFIGRTFRHFHSTRRQIRTTQRRL